ncbi:hypothetical protein [Salisediminibacterium beveridgei]|uniref:hypothetical protein n=1 Tax=Salisediminibacterium beveridgei TaxID=632773 RepID=UPI0012EDA402|nr:hypothetical protein [Salisediminibacterium beveridgei]
MALSTLLFDLFAGAAARYDVAKNRGGIDLGLAAFAVTTNDDCEIRKYLNPSYL